MAEYEIRKIRFEPRLYNDKNFTVVAPQLTENDVRRIAREEYEKLKRERSKIEFEDYPDL